MGHEVTHLAHQVDAQVLVLNPYMDMQPTDEQPISERLKVPGQKIVPFLVGVFLIVPESERMSR